MAASCGSHCSAALWQVLDFGSALRTSVRHDIQQYRWELGSANFYRAAWCIAKLSSGQTGTTCSNSINFINHT